MCEEQLMAKAKTPGKRPQGSAKPQVAAAAAAITVDSPEPKKPRTSPGQFISQVRAEVGKITWPTRREVITTTIMVLIMASLASIFFFLVDLGIKSGLAAVLGLVGS